MARTKRHMVAIPPEARSEEMSVILTTTIAFSAHGSVDDLCGRCGRILMTGMEVHTVTDLWLKCPKCGWFNGSGITAGWVAYAVEQLGAHIRSVEHADEILRAARAAQAANETGASFVARYRDDLGPFAAVIAQFSLPTFIAILALIYAVYSGQASIGLARQSLEVSQQPPPALTVPQSPQVEAPLTRADLNDLARELTRLQRAVAEMRIPPPPPRKKNARKGRRG